MRTLVSPLHVIPEFRDHLRLIGTFPKTIIEAMGGVEQFLTFPVLEWKKEYIGCTDYIDRIRPIDLSHPVMIGRDPYQRSFICLKMRAGVYPKEFVMTMFQRYTNQQDTWTHGRIGNLTIIPQSGYFLDHGRWKDNELQQNLSNLINNQSIIIHDTVFKLSP